MKLWGCGSELLLGRRATEDSTRLASGLLLIWFSDGNERDVVVMRLT
jgi:hypothetical protein